MILPWLQVDQDAFERGVELAAVLSIDEAQAVGHLVMLWRWALSRPADAQLTGVVVGVTAVAQIEAGARWRGPRGALVDALRELGLVELEGNQHRVRGLERYRVQVEKRAQDRERKAESRPKVDGAGIPPDGAGIPADIQRTALGKSGQTQTQTQTQTHMSLPSEETGRQPAKRPRRPDVSDADERHQPLVDGLCRVFEEVRGAKYPFKPRDALGVKALLLSGVAPATILDAWKRALQHRGFPTVSSPNELHDHLSHFVGVGPPSVARATVAQPSAWSRGETSTTVSETF